MTASTFAPDTSGAVKERIVGTVLFVIAAFTRPTVEPANSIPSLSLSLFATV